MNFQRDFGISQSLWGDVGKRLWDQELSLQQFHLPKGSCGSLAWLEKMELSKLGLG